MTNTNIKKYQGSIEDKVLESKVMESDLITYSELPNGEPFTIVEHWEIVDMIRYNIVEAIDPELIEMYDNLGLVSHYDVDEKGLDSVRVDGKIPKELTVKLDRLGYDRYDIVGSVLGSWGYSDDFIPCDDCEVVIDLGYSNYSGAESEYFIKDGIYCKDCFMKDKFLQEQYIEDKINNHTEAIESMLSKEDLKNLDFTMIEHTFISRYFGENNDPKTIVNELNNKGYSEVVFYIRRRESFRVEYNVFVRS